MLGASPKLVLLEEGCLQEEHWAIKTSHKAAGTILMNAVNEITVSSSSASTTLREKPKRKK